MVLSLAAWTDRDACGDLTWASDGSQAAKMPFAVVFRLVFVSFCYLQGGETWSSCHSGNYNERSSKDGERFAISPELPSFAAKAVGFMILKSINYDENSRKRLFSHRCLQSDHSAAQSCQIRVSKFARGLSKLHRQSC